eukprot:GHUV01031153.1.p1 GENE.GHUV01031153.1~~GHUV01031153.1.p1  ORF type:complete len:239 (+),score=71.22 GHUV01031153.1:123-839(+)
MSAAPLAPEPIVLFSFNTAKTVDKWHVFTDSYFGGKSEASFTYNAQEQAAEFSGRCTVEQSDDTDLKRAGYCVANSKVQHIGDYFDLSGFSQLVYRVKGDGRTYIANVRVDSLAGTGGDVWQAPFTTRRDVWSEVVIPVSALALTYQGQLVERKLEFQADKVIGVGVSVSAALPVADSSTTGPTDRTSSDGSTGETTSNSTSAADAAVQSHQHQQQQQVPDAELFRLFVREIRAEGEM